MLIAMPIFHIRVPGFVFIQVYASHFLLGPTLEDSKKWLKYLGPCHVVGNPGGVLGSSLWPGSNPAVMDIWNMKREESSVSLTLKSRKVFNVTVEYHVV